MKTITETDAAICEAEESESYYTAERAYAEIYGDEETDEDCEEEDED